MWPIDTLSSGIQMKQWEIAEIVAEVDTQGIGELGISEFLQIMTHTMHRLATEENGTRQPTVRRKILHQITIAVCFNGIMYVGYGIWIRYRGVAVPCLIDLYVW